MRRVRPLCFPIDRGCSSCSQPPETLQGRLAMGSVSLPGHAVPPSPCLPSAGFSCYALSRGSGTPNIDSSLQESEISRGLCPLQLKVRSYAQNRGARPWLALWGVSLHHPRLTIGSRERALSLSKKCISISAATSCHLAFGKIKEGLCPRMSAGQACVLMKGLTSPKAL